MAAIHGTAAEIIGELAKLFPQAFSTDPSTIRPLIVGMKEALLQLCKRSPESLDNALRYYTGSVSYLKRMTESAARVDLKGQPAGLVTARQAKAAQHRLAAKGGKVAPTRWQPTKGLFSTWLRRKRPLHRGSRLQRPCHHALAFPTSSGRRRRGG